MSVSNIQTLTYSLRSQVSFIESFTGSHFSVLPFSNVLVLLLELGMGELNHILRFLIRKCIFLNSFLFYTISTSIFFKLKSFNTVSGIFIFLYVMIV